MATKFLLHTTDAMNVVSEKIKLGQVAVRWNYKISVFSYFTASVPKKVSFLKFNELGFAVLRI